MFTFTQPLIKETNVFSRLPDEYRRSDKKNAWSLANRGGAPVHSFLEGPVFDSRENLYVTDIPYGRIFKITPAGEWSLVAEYDGEPNGMKFYDDKTLVIADYKNGLLLLDVDSGQVSTLLDRRNTERFKGINDLVFDSAGNLYFTDQGQTGLHDPTGRVYRLSLDGRLDCLLSNAPSPNGLVLSTDEEVLFVAMTRGNCVWRVPLMRDGSVSKVGQFFTSYGPSGPDGLAMDESGRLIVCNPGLGVGWVLNQKGEPEEVLKSVAGASLTNIAFGGANRSTAYFTESVTGTVLYTKMSAPGCKLYMAI
uniref:SMP-30/gluconolactonase/LRE family protein n=1 Tax=Marinobacterium profundum TaxID=1714300 RepID=UPI00082E9084|nr:SMP-30/gluconolactonase/LRE family protein [Marinobacterium profundum]